MSSADEQAVVAASVGRQVEAIVSAAERAASEVAKEVETSAMERAREILEGAQSEADRVIQEAAARCTEYLDTSRQRIDDFAAARIQRLTELTDGIIAVAGSIEERYERAEIIKRQLEELISTIGAVAEAVAQEVAAPNPELPQAPARQSGERPR